MKSVLSTYAEINLTKNFIEQVVKIDCLILRFYAFLFLYIWKTNDIIK